MKSVHSAALKEGCRTICCS